MSGTGVEKDDGERNLARLEWLFRNSLSHDLLGTMTRPSGGWRVWTEEISGIAFVCTDLRMYKSGLVMKMCLAPVETPLCIALIEQRGKVLSRSVMEWGDGLPYLQRFMRDSVSGYRVFVEKVMFGISDTADPDSMADETETVNTCIRMRRGEFYDPRYIPACDYKHFDIPDEYRVARDATNDRNQHWKGTMDNV